MKKRLKTWWETEAAWSVLGPTAVSSYRATRPPCDERERERQRVALGAKIYTPWYMKQHVGYDYDVCLRRVM